MSFVEFLDSVRYFKITLFDFFFFDFFARLNATACDYYTVKGKVLVCGL